MSMANYLCVSFAGHAFQAKLSPVSSVWDAGGVLTSYAGRRV